LTERHGVGAAPRPRSSCRSLMLAGAEATPRSPRCRGPARCRPAAARRCGTGSTAAATARRTARSTPSPRPAWGAAPHRPQALPRSRHQHGARRPDLDGSGGR
jgi:hypothetical protein